MKKIIAATDFSSAATNALNYAVDMAIHVEANLILFHCYPIPIAYKEIPTGTDLDAIQLAEEVKISGYINELKERTGSALSIRAEVTMGLFFQELELLCEKEEPYAVVMGSQGMTAAERFLFGSHTIHAMKKLAWPLVTVPPTASFNAVKKIGLACDFENVIETVPVEEIKKLLHDFGAELHVINTGRWDKYDPNRSFGSSMLKSMLEPVSPQVHFIYNENTDDAILKFAEQNHIDLLAVIPKRHGLVQKIVGRSHSKEIILKSRVPVLVLHPQVQP